MHKNLLLITLLLSGCASSSLAYKTDTGNVANYTSVLAAYTSLPACSDAVVVKCKDPSVVTVIRQAVSTYQKADQNYYAALQGGSATPGLQASYETSVVTLKTLSEQPAVQTALK